MARPIVLFLHLFRLAGAFNFRNDYSPPLVCHLDLSSAIGARSLICGLHRSERIASSGLDVCETHIFMSQTLHFGKITCLIIFVQRDLSFDGLSLVVSLMSWTIEISPKLKEFSMNLMHMLVVI